MYWLDIGDNCHISLFGRPFFPLKLSPPPTPKKSPCILTPVGIVGYKFLYTGRVLALVPSRGTGSMVTVVKFEPSKSINFRDTEYQYRKFHLPIYSTFQIFFPLYLLLFPSSRSLPTSHIS